MGGEVEDEVDDDGDVGEEVTPRGVHMLLVSHVRYVARKRAGEGEGEGEDE